MTTDLKAADKLPREDDRRPAGPLVHLGIAVVFAMIIASILFPARIERVMAGLLDDLYEVGLYDGLWAADPNACASPAALERAAPTVATISIGPAASQRDNAPTVELDTLRQASARGLAKPAGALYAVWPNQSSWLVLKPVNAFELEVLGILHRGRRSSNWWTLPEQHMFRGEAGQRLHRCS